MGKLKTQTFVKKNNGILKVIEKLQKSFIQARNWGPSNTSIIRSDKEAIPVDVKEGHFAVIAADDDEERRFVVPLAYLARPSFQRLLERAAEEYGFNHEGALMVPCRPSKLELMLRQRESAAGDDVDWSLCNTIVESY